MGNQMWYWINLEKRRYYQADLLKDLFGDWTLVCGWGSLETRHGNRRIDGLASYEEGLRKIDALDVRRHRRGYVRVSSLADWRTQVAAMHAERAHRTKPQEMDRPDADEFFVLE